MRILVIGGAVLAVICVGAVQIANSRLDHTRVRAAEANKAVAEVRTAVALNQDQQDRLAKALGEATGRQVTLKVVIDPSVLGGVVAQVGDTVIDGSVRTKLERLRKAL